jgi:L-iditol 2-dehydrogenase
MKVATWHGGTRFTLDDVPEPVAGPGQVVVEVQTAGICGTDVHATQGLFPYKPPLVLGHEYTGIVRAVCRSASWAVPWRVSPRPAAASAPSARPGG